MDNSSPDSRSRVAISRNSVCSTGRRKKSASARAICRELLCSSFSKTYGLQPISWSPARATWSVQRALRPSRSWATGLSRKGQGQCRMKRTGRRRRRKRSALKAPHADPSKKIALNPITSLKMHGPFRTTSRILDMKHDRYSFLPHARLISAPRTVSLAG